ncbi:MAG: tetratricopeptide repeat protein [Myxococcales bacterium]|nr:tetratricopeptide repeat protein [Myxococcales bacterium]MCB9577501.1 tetratricopeptide repeat protein [Polyangiaceae bacterium]
MSLSLRLTLFACFLSTVASAAGASPEQLLDQGRALRQSGRFDDAVKVLRKSYGRARSGDVAAAVRYEAARSLIEAGKQKQALAECRTLGPVAPAKADACRAEAYLLWRRASLALPSAERALSRAPKDYDALVAKGRALRQMGKPKEAEQALRDALTSDGKRYEAHLELGELLSAQGQKKRAIAELEKAHQLAPREPAPLLVLGQELPAGKAAAAHLAEAIKIRPQYGAAHARLGEVLLAQGDTAGAEAALQKALAVDGKQADWRAALGRVLLAKGDATAALAEAQAALKLVSNNGAAKLVAADALAAKGDIDLAIEAYEQAHGYARTDPTPLVHAAKACLAQARPTTARAFADRATQSFPKHGPGWEVLGDVHAHAKETAAARKAYLHALKSTGTDRARVQKKLAALK